VTQKRISRQEVRDALSCPVTSISTPFNADGSIDFDGLRNFVDHAIAGCSKTMLLTYGDSLYSSLTDEEVAQVTKVVAKHTAGRALVVAADRIWATPREVEFARYARQVGADLLMVLPPDWAESCTVESLVEHYAAVAAHIPVMVVTNYLMPRGIELGLTVLENLRDRVDGIVAIKDDVCGEFARKMTLLVHDKWTVISGGQKQNHLNMLPYGCHGYLSTFARFCPRIARKYWTAIQTADFAIARDVIRDYDMPYFDFIMSLPGGFDAGIHATLELFGIAKRYRRKPYYSLDDAQMEQLAQFFRKHSLL